MLLLKEMFLPFMQEEAREQVKKLLLCLSLPACRGEDPPLLQQQGGSDEVHLALEICSKDVVLLQTSFKI